VLFNEIHYRTNKNIIKINDSIEVLRNAVRAVIIIENKILLAHLGKTGEYKFPGGGIQENETIQEALKREVLEEVGFSVIKINEKIGEIIEYDVAKEGSGYYFKMISEYYVAEIDNIQLQQNLEEDEERLLFKPCWIKIKVTIQSEVFSETEKIRCQL
jgi:8-oxo-dGTP pyrophosphatase MutT (NUDIX family)